MKINNYSFVILFCLFTSFGVFAQTSYTSITMPTGLHATSPASATTRVVTGDFDNDGDIDMLTQLNGTDGSQVDYHQNNGGTYTIISGTGSPSTFSSGPFNGLSFNAVRNSNLFVADYDNDGDMDIFETSANPTPTRFLRNTSGIFSSVTVPTNFPTVMSTAGFARFVIGDFNNDGDIDFLHQQGTGSASIFYCDNDGIGNFTQHAANGAGAFTSGIFNGVTMINVLSTNVMFPADYDNDGDIDIYQYQAAGSIYYKNNGASWAIATVPSGLPALLNAGRFLPSDYDADGDIDVLYQTGTAVPAGINFATNNGSGTYTSVTADGTGTFSSGPFSGITLNDIFASILFPFDYDTDGDIDLYRIPLGASGTNFLYRCGGVPPSLTSRSPLNGATGVSTATNLTMTFNEIVTAGTSTNNIYIKRFSDDAVIQTIASNSGSVSGSGTTNITVALAALATSTKYYVAFDDQAFKDNQGLIFGYYDHFTKERKSFKNKSFWSFTTGVLSTDSFELNSKFAIYPNPTSGGIVNVKSDFDGDFQIVNQIGQVIKAFKVTANTVNIINVENIAQGIYFIKATDGGKIGSQKLIKN